MCVKLGQCDCKDKEKDKEKEDEKEIPSLVIGITDENNKLILNGYSQSYGACFYCSYQYAYLTFNSWYDPGNNYRYYNTCSCPYIPGCGKHGSIKNDYCSRCKQSIPTVTISVVTNRFGQTTYHSHCYYCAYDIVYYY